MIRHNNISIDRSTKTITVGERSVKFRHGHRTFRALSHLLLIGTRGASTEELFDVVYGHQIDGGPDDGFGVIPVLVIQAQPYLQKLGMKIVKYRLNSRVRYGLRVV